MSKYSGPYQVTSQPSPSSYLLVEGVLHTRTALTQACFGAQLRSKSVEMHDLTLFNDTLRDSKQPEEASRKPIAICLSIGIFEVLRALLSNFRLPGLTTCRPYYSSDFQAAFSTSFQNRVSTVANLGNRPREVADNAVSEVAEKVDWVVS